MKYEINNYGPATGRRIREDGSIVNIADKINDIHKALTGNFTRLSTEPKPTTDDGAMDGSTLMLVDTAQVFIFYQNVWSEI